MLQAFGDRRRLLDHGRVLLGHAVELRDGIGNLADARGLRDTGSPDLGDQLATL